MTRLKRPKNSDSAINASLVVSSSVLLGGMAALRIRDSHLEQKQTNVVQLRQVITNQPSTDELWVPVNICACPSGINNISFTLKYLAG